MFHNIKNTARKVATIPRPPEGPEGYFVYRDGKNKLFFAVNGKVKACWIPPKKAEDGKKPGFWKEVNSLRKVTLDGEPVPLTEGEKMQFATAF